MSQTPNSAGPERVKDRTEPGFEKEYKEIRDLNSGTSKLLAEKQSELDAWMRIFAKKKLVDIHGNQTEITLMKADVVRSRKIVMATVKYLIIDLKPTLTRLADTAGKCAVLMQKKLEDEFDEYGSKKVNVETFVSIVKEMQEMQDFAQQLNSSIAEMDAEIYLAAVQILSAEKDINAITEVIQGRVRKEKVAQIRREEEQWRLEEEKKRKKHEEKRLIGMNAINRMPDDEDKLTEEMVSSYIANTCQLHPKSFPVVPDEMHNLIPRSCHYRRKYPVLCGSSAEFFIRPLNSCIADNDLLVSTVDELAFSGDDLVLPYDLNGLPERIEFFKIESYQRYPGFVRLRGVGEARYDWIYKIYKYMYNPTDISNSYKKLDLTVLNEPFRCMGVPDEKFFCVSIMGGLSNSVGLSGPAIKFEAYGDSLGSDVVESVWCPQWPSDARAWSDRPRRYGLPTTATISEVLQSGCHVVYVQHRSCRHDKEQWRLSFSVAEVILLQSWTQVQQTVYHLLRFFAKRELLQKDCPKEDEILCAYHLKTLMLWTCEEMPPDWWNTSSVIAICRELLQKLSLWLRRKDCPNYFIPEANLFHESSSFTILDEIESRLQRFSASDVLCHWFVDNYILDFFRMQFKVDRTVNRFIYSSWHSPGFLAEKESDYLDVLFSTRFSYSRGDFICKIGKPYAVQLCHILQLKYHTTKIHTDRYLTTAQNVLCFMYYANLLYISHVAEEISFGQISWDNSLLVELMREIPIKRTLIRSEYHNFPTPHKESHRFEILLAQELMENLTASNSSSEFQLLSLISKTLIRTALDSGSLTCPGCKCFAPAAFAYMATLHFATSEYQEAIRFCSAVLVDQTSRKEREPLNAGSLLFIDDIARIVGLRVLYKKIIENNLQYINRRFYLDLRLSPDVFAHYLSALSDEKMSTPTNFHHDLPDSLSPVDECLKTFMKSKCAPSTKSDTRLNAIRFAETEFTIVNSLMEGDDIINLLMKYALENMTTFYSAIHKDFGIQCNTADCYRALYFYKCRKYDEMVTLCERILQEPDLEKDMQKYGFANVLLLPPLDSFFDRDVQSLLGFHTLFYCLSPLNDPYCDHSEDVTLETYFFHRARFHKAGLSTSLQMHYFIKYNYFLGRHFLARYLKVRYCIDCHHAFTSELTDFATQKINLPFEQIIGRFLLRKLHVQ